METVSIRAHSSFRIIVDYTPKKSNRGESSLELRGQSFFLLFEIRSKRDYGEIGLFCRAQTCQSRLAVTPAIHYRNCVPGGSFTQSMVITNEVGNSGFFGLILVVSVGVSRGYRVLCVVAAVRVSLAGIAGLGGLGAPADADRSPHRRYRLFPRYSRKRGDFRPGDVHGPHDAQRISQLRRGFQRRGRAAAVSAVRGKIGAIFVIPRFGPIFCSRTRRCITRF